MTAFTVADDTTLTELIGKATHRLVFVAPAVSNAVAEALIERLQELRPESVSITLDVDGEVIRLGYGDQDAIDRLYEATRKAGKPLTRHEGIRVGLVIADETMLVFAPNPLFIEAGPKNPMAHNAVMVGPPPPSVIVELGLGPKGVIDQTVGLDIASADTIKQVKKDLEQNPPQKFDIARTVQVFNAHVEFVEFKLRGADIDRKTIRIPSDLMGLAGDPNTQALLEASFHLVGETDDLPGKTLQEDKKKIIKRFLKVVPGYRTAILRVDKPAFEKAVQIFTVAVSQFQKGLKDKLQKAMDCNQERLLQALLPSVQANPPAIWRMADGTLLVEKDQVEARLDAELARAFGTADQLIGKMEVSVVFKGVTYESLKDPAFVTVAKKAFPSLAKLLDEYKAARATELPMP